MADPKPPLDAIPHDKARWHYEGDYPEELPIENAFTFGGFFFGWAIDQHLVDPDFERGAAAEIHQFRTRAICASRLYQVLGGSLAHDMLSCEGNFFAAHYLDKRHFRYWDDYCRVFHGSRTPYHVDDTWDNYVRICLVIDQAFARWKKANRIGRSRVLEGGRTMGFSFSSVAVRNGSRDAVLNVLGLRGTGVHSCALDSHLSGAPLPSGWYLVIANHDYPAFMKGKMLRQLSAGAVVVTCFVEEHVMHSEASLWAAGRHVGSVCHDASRGIDHLATIGRPPEVFLPISQQLRAEQQAAADSEPIVDYLFDVPVEVVSRITGYRHDRAMAELGEKPFEALAKANDL